MTNRLRKEYHMFFLTDYEHEEEFLRQKHQQGERLVKVMLPGFFYFEPCEPEDVVYKLDFCPQSREDKESYIQMFRDYGWEYIQDLNEYSYFRKPVEEVSENENDIFSDEQSRLDMLERIFKRRMLPLLAVFLLCIIPQFGRLFIGAKLGLPDIVILFIFAVLFLAYIYLFIHCGIGYQRLKKKYSQGGIR